MCNYLFSWNALFYTLYSLISPNISSNFFLIFNFILFLFYLSFEYLSKLMPNSLSFTLSDKWLWLPNAYASSDIQVDTPFFLEPWFWWCVWTSKLDFSCKQVPLILHFSMFLLYPSLVIQHQNLRVVLDSFLFLLGHQFIISGRFYFAFATSVRIIRVSTDEMGP